MCPFNVAHIVLNAVLFSGSRFREGLLLFDVANAWKILRSLVGSVKSVTDERVEDTQLFLFTLLKAVFMK